ncbi:hypothetical protein L873DRAFT_1035360 [Choiromyces venosus 120613-1]|uniref:Uncharacterized protein n=1 Tax=Choiromyces venosus 120613-1 TaxID=1336337 RepID=A0A3N4JJX3_9PEZI|nr:hypothetical protein L873DRAFT_1035360 [Choiromyces venosus 120613-1]
MTRSTVWYRSKLQYLKVEIRGGGLRKVSGSCLGNGACAVVVLYYGIILDLHVFFYFFISVLDVCNSCRRLNARFADDVLVQ